MSAADRTAYVRDQARSLLDPDTDDERELVEWLCLTLSVPGSLQTLVGLVSRHMRNALREAAHVGRQEALIAVAELVAEVDGPDAVDEAIQAVKAGGHQ